MNKYFIFILILFSVLSCRDYESEEYIKNENEAINDLILELTNFSRMSELNKWERKLNLYLFSELDNKAPWIEKPKGYTISINGIDLPKEELEKNKNEYSEYLEQYKKTKRLFSPLYKEKMKRRKLNFPFSNDSLKIKLSNTETEKIKDGDFGYLSISRIVFNNNFTVGYLHYGFYCGMCCAWNNAIEIKKINNKYIYF